MANKIYLSPSNQNANPYKGQNTNEMEQCNRIAAAAEKHLKRNGYEVKRAPKGQDMSKSIAESNAWKADVHIPIHTNAGGGKGPLVMVYSKATVNMKYAQPVYNELLKACPSGVGYGVRLGSDMTSGHWMPSELTDTSGIGVYCECEFHDNAEIAKWIVNNVDKIGEAIAKGICAADGKTYKKEVVAQTTTTTGSIYRVQIGAFVNKANAEKLLAELKTLGYTGLIVEQKK